jgi:hypothetical protein
VIFALLTFSIGSLTLGIRKRREQKTREQ